MTVSPSSVTVGSTNNDFVFHFVNNSGSTFAGNSILKITVPAGWTAPQESNSNSAGYVTIANTTCSTSGSNGPSNGSNDISESGNVITVVIAGCVNNASFDLRYQNLTAPTANNTDTRWFIRYRKYYSKPYNHYYSRHNSSCVGSGYSCSKSNNRHNSELYI
jgi:hypothetical protein